MNSQTRIEILEKYLADLHDQLESDITTIETKLLCKEVKRTVEKIVKELKHNG